MKLEIYFDYLCEFCEMGHRYWTELLPRYPEIEPVWMPCEAHPRTEEPGYGFHSDLAIQGMLFVREHGGDAALYNDSLFEAVYRRGENIEDPRVLAGYAEKAGADPGALKAALASHAYEQAQRDANRRAYGEMAVRAVPTYVLEDGRRVDSILGVGVPKKKLESFLQMATAQGKA